MGDATEMVKIQQSKQGILSATVQAQLAVAGTALATIIDACNATDAVGAPVKTPSMVYISAVVTIIGALYTIWARARAEGPLTWRKAPREQPPVLLVDSDHLESARRTSTEIKKRSST